VIRGVKVTNSTNVISIAKNSTLTVIDCCAPPPLRLTAHCIAAGPTLIASVVTPNPLTVGAAAHLVVEILEEC